MTAHHGLRLNKKEKLSWEPILVTLPPDTRHMRPAASHLRPCLPHHDRLTMESWAKVPIATKVLLSQCLKVNVYEMTASRQESRSYPRSTAWEHEIRGGLIHKVLSWPTHRVQRGCIGESTEQKRKHACFWKQTLSHMCLLTTLTWYFASILQSLYWSYTQRDDTTLLQEGLSISTPSLLIQHVPYFHC